MSSTLPLVEETKFLIPVVTILGITVIFTILTVLLKIKIIPTFVLEIFIGIILKQIFYDSSFKIQYDSIIEVMYSIGFIFIMFLSGYDNNLYLIKQERNNYNNMNIRKISIIFLILIYLISFLLSILLIKYYYNKLYGIILLTITISSTFAGVVIPLIKSNNLLNTLSGKFITYFSTISELTSIILLTILMILVNVNAIKLTGFLLLVLLFLLIWLINNITKNSTKKITEGFTFISLRIIIVFLGISVILCEFIGGEYVLGAFLLGMFLKKINFNENEIEKIESFCYGFFAPVFFVLVGAKLDVRLLIINPKNMVIVLLLTIMFVLSKFPILYLIKSFNKKDVVAILALTTCTLIVGLAVSHFGIANNIFSGDFGECIIFSSIITCVISSVIYEKITDNNINENT